MLFHNLVASAKSTLDGNNVMADNQKLYLENELDFLLFTQLNSIDDTCGWSLMLKTNRKPRKHNNMLHRHICILQSFLFVVVMDLHEKGRDVRRDIQCYWISLWTLATWAVSEITQ